MPKKRVPTKKKVLKKKVKKLEVGDRVYFQYVLRRVLGTIVEDRGNLGVGGRRILSVRADPTPDEQPEPEAWIAEIAEENLRLVRRARRAGSRAMPKKGPRKLERGDRVYFMYGLRRVLGTVVGDRGNLGVGGRRILCVRTDPDPYEKPPEPEPWIVEVAEEDLRLVRRRKPRRSVA